MKVSVITINRNNARGLEKTIQSVISQTFTDYEYLIIDGYSSDGSIAVINMYAKNLAYWVSEPDAGIYNAMNKGIKRAKGEYVIFMNSGDRFVDSNVLQQVFSKDRSADFVVGSVKREYKHFTMTFKSPSKISFYSFWVNSLPHQATFTKCSLFTELGLYDEQLMILADWKFSLLALTTCHKSIEIIDDCIAVLENGGLSESTGSSLLIRKEKELTLKTYFPHLVDDYTALHKYRRFTLDRWKKYCNWMLHNLLTSKIH